jgi:hypothetical protein
MADYEQLLRNIQHLCETAAAVTGADTVGAFLPIRKFGNSRPYGEFSNLQDWLNDVAETLQAYLDVDGEEIEGWET